ncbi:hypothetical protein HK098_002820 [Nowakowskiella sp. JEL0407]|nr:hypothetical protein HK098_002820 [Nowakowskiella sp. JEL0407]
MCQMESAHGSIRPGLAKLLALNWFRIHNDQSINEYAQSGASFHNGQYHRTSSLAEYQIEGLAIIQEISEKHTTFQPRIGHLCWSWLLLRGIRSFLLDYEPSKVSKGSLKEELEWMRTSGNLKVRSEDGKLTVVEEVNDNDVEIDNDETLSGSVLLRLSPKGVV